MLNAPMIQFQAKYLPSLYHFMGQKDIRYWLNGAYIEPHADGGALLVATNGHMLMAIIDSTANCTQPAVFSVCNDAVRHCSRGGLVRISEQDERLIVLDNFEQELYVQPRKCLITGHAYPTFKNVFPDFQKIRMAMGAYLNGSLLAKIVKAHPHNGKRGILPVLRFWQQPLDDGTPNENASVIVQFDGAPEYLGVLMPCRGDSGNKVPDQWIKYFAYGDKSRAAA